MTTALFEAWRGRYADSPRAVADYLGAHLPAVRQEWVSDGRTHFPDGVTAVARHKPRHFWSLYRADLLVTNDLVSRYPAKGRGQTYVQCWHGMPLKAIGNDELRPRYVSADSHLRRMRADTERWDLLLSSNPDCTRIFRRAFGYEGPVLEIGLPRNDLLVGPGAAAVRDRVRTELGIGADETCVLYAPTWRDDSRDAEGRIVQTGMPDFDRLAAALGPTVRVLTRLHKSVHVRPEWPAGMVDVTDYPDIADLYLAADVFVSDYSSAVFDFAATGKPILLYAPDLAHYRDDVRPFYFDYESWAPGPILGTTDELVDALRGGREVAAEHRQRYADFRARFCPYDDGLATQRLVAELQRRGTLPSSD